MPQHARRLKIRRKDLRKPDEFETLTGQAVAWVDEHRPVVYVVLAVAVAVLAGGLAIGRWRASRNDAAAVAFRSAQARFDEGNFKDAAPAFAYVVERYPRAPFGRLAALYRAHALARQGDQAGAATAYGEYLAGAADTDYLRQEALVGLARAKEATGDTAGALDAYTQAGARPGPYRDDALLSAARLEQAAGHAERAQAIYAELLKDAADPAMKAFVAAKVPGAARSSNGGEATADTDPER
jgi:thioredoxin-like negative regulator of GroEL